MLNQLPLDKIIKTATKNGGDYCDIYFESSNLSSIIADNKMIEKVISGIDSGIGVRVIHNGNSAYGFTNDLSEKSLLNLASSVSEAIKSKQIELNLNFEQKKPLFSQKIIKTPDKISLDHKIDLVKKLNNIAWNFDKKIQQVSVTYKDTVKKVEIVNSLGEFITDTRIDTICLAVIIASNGKVIQTGYEPIGGFWGFEKFDSDIAENSVIASCKRAIQMLSAKPAPAGKMPVVLSSEAGGTMVHEAVGHGLEADLALNGFSVYQNQIGQVVASPLITVVDDATIPEKRGSFSFDDEGIHAQKTILIENGVLKTYMHNRITALKAKVAPTGNGRRESYRFRPSVRMTNTLIQPGQDNPQSIIADTDHGLFVKKMGGGQVNTVNGDFVFEVQEGHIIRNGKITEPVRGATLTGNGPEILKQIDRVGNDLGFAIGTCGKDHQGVPVGDAQPTIRIPEIIVGGTQES